MRLTPSAQGDTFCRDRLPPLDQWPDFRSDLVSYPEKLNCAVELLGGTDRDRPCLRDPSGRVWSYGEVDDTTSQLAQVLADEGLVPGNRVLLRGPNNPWLALSWLAVLKAGGGLGTTMFLLAAPGTGGCCAGRTTRGSPCPGWLCSRRAASW